MSLGVQAITCGDAEIVIAGGQENMSQSGHILLGSRDGCRMGNASLVDTMLRDGLTDTFGVTIWVSPRKMWPENMTFLARSRTNLQRPRSKGLKARAEGRFDDEIVPVMVPQRKKDPVEFKTDEFIRDGVTAEALSKLRPAFDGEGTVTAGRVRINDGAAAVLWAWIRLKLGTIRNGEACTSAGVDPEIMVPDRYPQTRSV